MYRRLLPTRYIPTGAEERRFDDIPAVVYLYPGREGQPAAIAYGGKRNKPDWHFRFPNSERREKKIADWIEGLKAHTESVKAYREKRKADPAPWAKGAASLKADLERNFPGVKFSVRSDTFSMGDAIRVSWTDGPTQKAVEMIADRYQHGRFNGTEDIYEYDHEGDYSKGSAKWVTCSRHISPAVYLKAAREVGFEIKSGESDRSGCLPGLDWEQSQNVYRKAHTIDARTGFYHPHAVTEGIWAV